MDGEETNLGTIQRATRTGILSSASPVRLVDDLGERTSTKGNRHGKRSLLVEIWPLPIPGASDDGTCCYLARRLRSPWQHDMVSVRRGKAPGVLGRLQAHHDGGDCVAHEEAPVLASQERQSILK